MSSGARHLRRFAALDGRSWALDIRRLVTKHFSASNQAVSSAMSKLMAVAGSWRTGMEVDPQPPSISSNLRPLQRSYLLFRQPRYTPPTHDMFSKEAIERRRAEKEVLLKLRAASRDREAAFTVSGSCSLAQGEAVRLDYAAGGALVQLSFPASAEDGAFQALVASCKPASFGKGTETVLDPEYRRALTLGPEDFLTSFSVAEHGLLSHVQRLMMPEAAAVTATLLKFNIYQEVGQVGRVGRTLQSLPCMDPILSSLSSLRRAASSRATSTPPAAPTCLAPWSSACRCSTREARCASRTAAAPCCTTGAPAKKRVWWRFCTMTKVMGGA